MLKKKYSYDILAFLIPFFACLLICIINGVYPFGDQCILHVDMYHQYCPFFTELMDKLKNGGSLMYTWKVGLGSDFIALYAYYLASPLNWLLVIWPKNFVIEFMTLTIFIKIGLAGLNFYLFAKYSDILKGQWQSKNQMVILVFSTGYALSAFVAAYNWDIMWMDGVALAPLVILGLKKLIYEKKPALYTISLAIAVLANYYIAMMICFFAVFAFFYYIIDLRKNIISHIGRFSIFSLLAGGCGAVLIIPESIILSYSGSSGINFPQRMEFYFNVMEEIARTSFMADVYTGSQYYPNLYAGAFVLPGILLFVLSRKIALKDKLLKLFMMGFFLLSFANNYLDFIWHGLHFPDSLPARQSFLFIFLILVMGYEAVRNLSYVGFWEPLIACLVSVCLYIIAMNMANNIITDSYAFVFTVLLILLYGCLALAYLANKDKKEAIRLVFVIVAIGELVVNMAGTGLYTTGRTSYLAKREAFNDLLKTAEEESDGQFYRVEDVERNTKNDDSLFGYSSATEFSSLMNINVSHFYQNLFLEGGKNFYCYNGSNPLTSAMLSVKYILYDSPLEESPYRKMIDSEDGQYLYENIYNLPLGYMMDDTAVSDWENSDTKKIDSINALAYSLGAKEPMLENINASNDVNCGSTSISVEETGYYYICYLVCDSDTLTIRTSAGKERKYSKTSHSYLMEVGQLAAGDSFEITNTNDERICFNVYKLNDSSFKTAFDSLNSQTMEVDSFSDTDIKGHIKVKKAGNLVFSIPAEEGWKLYINGKESSYDSLKDAFIMVWLDEGNYDIELRYRTPGLLAGGLITGGCIIVFILIMFLPRFFKKKEEMIEYTV